MKGLLLKDLYMAAKYCRAYILLTIMLAVGSVFSESAFLLFYPILMAGVIPVNLISYDEKSRWSMYAEVFPYTRKELVSAKYMITLIFLGMGVIMIGTAQVIGMVRSGLYDWISYWKLISVLPVMGLLSPCILLPVVFKLGVEKGRIIFFGVIAAICGFLGALGAVGMETKAGSLLSLVSGRWLIPAMLIFGALLLAVSWKISAHFYQTREFC